MRINVRMKMLGKRRPVLGEVSIEISDTVKTLRELLTELVKIEVERYNQKGVDTQLIPFLSKEGSARPSGIVSTAGATTMNGERSCGSFWREP